MRFWNNDAARRATTQSTRTSGFDLSPTARMALTSGGALLLAMSVVALGRAGVGGVAIPARMFEPAVIIHLVTVLIALPLGMIIFLSRKGGARHRTMGKAWLLLMVVTAIATFFIRHLNDGQLSYIHLLSVLTLVSVPRAINAARQGNIALHRRRLVSMFAGALIVAGLASFIPGRIMYVFLLG